MTGLHVVIVPSWWPSPEQPINGIFHVDYARAFAAAGARVGIVVPDQVSPRCLGAGTSIPWIPRITRERIAGPPDIPVVRIRGLHTALGQPGIQMRRYRRWLARGLDIYAAEHGEPDILHAMCAIPAGWACTHLFHRWDTLARHVVVTENTGPFSLVLSPRKGEAYVRAGLARATAIIAVSEPLRRDMRAAGINVSIDVVPNPVEEIFVGSPPPNVLRDADKRPLYRGLFVGRLTGLKGIQELVQAAIVLSQDTAYAVEWHFAGYGELEPGARQRFAEAGLSGQAVFHGLREKKAVANLVAASHFLVLPSHGENCPLAICEALASGRPVIGTRGTGCEPLIGEGDGELCDVGNARSLADAVRRLLADYSRWDWRAIAARARARFSFQAVAERYGDIFRRVGECRIANSE
ncbi:MAG TPA: glycosyltransferase [Phycisphaerae bacterium]|nr:glycosyltransferase [Phycisphaerae bacterium]